MLHFDTFFEPEKKLEQEKKNANYVTGLINYLIGPAIIGILLGLGVTILSLIAQTIMMVSPVPQVQAIAPFLSLGVFGIIWVPILVIISASIFAFLINLFIKISEYEQKSCLPVCYNIFFHFSLSAGYKKSSGHLP